MLMRIPGLLGPTDVAGLVARLGESAPWVDGRATAGHQGATVKRNLQLEERSELARTLGDTVLAALERHALFVSATLPHRVYPPMFNRYDVGMHFGAHVDGAVRGLPGSGSKLRADLSATLFLSPPQSYDGGELVIERRDESPGYKLEAGDMLVYPTTALHRVTTVTRGVRLACVFWIQSLVRSEAERDQLFELDCTIARLTDTGADPESVVRLTSHYHNLLRLWSAT